MRRIVTWLLVGAVVALGAAAAVDALRGGSEPERAETRASTRSTVEGTTGPASSRTGIAAALREAGIEGVLEYADEDCDTHAVSLPDLTARPSGVGGACSFAVSAAGPSGFAVACGDGRVRISDAQQAPYALVRANCSPAWKPGGTPTLLLDGEVVEPHPCPDARILPMRCTRTLLSRADLERELGATGWTGFRFAVEQLEWLSDSRAAAIVRARSRDDRVELITVVENRRLVTVPTAGYEDLTALRPSPSGSFVAAQIADPGGVVVVDRAGAVIRPLVGHGTALAWSPDERWIAEATDDGLYIFPADGRAPRVYVLPIVARDLVWR